MRLRFNFEDKIQYSCKLKGCHFRKDLFIVWLRKIGTLDAICISDLFEIQTGEGEKCIFFSKQNAENTEIILQEFVGVLVGNSRVSIFCTVIDNFVKEK